MDAHMESLRLRQRILNRSHLITSLTKIPLLYNLTFIFYSLGLTKQKVTNVYCLFSCIFFPTALAILDKTKRFLFVALDKTKGCFANQCIP
jgi:hypothetical protein